MKDTMFGSEIPAETSIRLNTPLLIHTVYFRGGDENFGISHGMKWDCTTCPQALISFLTKPDNRNCTLLPIARERLLSS